MNAKKTLPATSPFATKETVAADVSALISAAAEHVGPDGVIDWKNFPQAVRPFDVAGGSLKIGYSRAWLIVRRAWLEMNDPKSLTKLPAATGDKDATNRAWSKVISPMRDEQQLSWGEISVRVGVPESKIRTCYRATGAKKDLGLRIGKGGRFAYGEPEFYLEHRKDEGAQIPSDLKGKPAVEQLMNAKNAKGEVVRFKKVIRSSSKAPKAVAS